jgi:hypothetical protein
MTLKDKLIVLSQMTAFVILLTFVAVLFLYIFVAL